MLSRTNYTIGGVQSKMEMQAPCSKIIKNFKIGVAEHEANKPISMKLCHMRCSVTARISNPTHWLALLLKPARNADGNHGSWGTAG